MQGSGSVGRVRRVLTRAVLPRMALRAFWLRRRAQVIAAKLGATPSIELYFAFDDPYGTVAVPGVIELARRHDVELTLVPVVVHGLEGDPDQPLRVAASLIDAARLLRRQGRLLARREPIAPRDVAFLAAWTEAARVRGKEAELATEALAALWERNEPIDATGTLGAIYQRVVGEAPPTERASWDRIVTHNEQELRGRGHWETPAARIAGEWFFAHERIETMGELLTLLGKPARSAS